MTKREELANAIQQTLEAQGDYPLAVDAILDCLMESSGHMVGAGCDMMEQVSGHDPEYDDSDDVKAVWMAMVEAAKE